MVVKIKSGEDLARLGGAYIKAGGTSMFFIVVRENSPEDRFPFYVKMDPEAKTGQTLEVMSGSTEIPSVSVETAIACFKISSVGALSNTKPETVAVRFETLEDLTDTVELLKKLGGRCPTYKYPDSDSFPCSFKFPKKVQKGRLYTIYNYRMGGTIEPEELIDMWLSTSEPENMQVQSAPKFELKSLIW